MFGEIAQLILNILATLFGAALLFRIWLRAAKIPVSNPLTQALHQLTDWLVLPLRKMIGHKHRFDFAALLAAYIVALAYLLTLVSLHGANIGYFFPQVFFFALLILMKWTLNLAIWTTIIYVLMSWLNPRAPAMVLLAALLAPILMPIRRILPNLANIDLSPIVLVVAAQILLVIVSRFEQAFTLGLF